MVKPLYCCLFLPVTLLAALCTDTRISFKFVCIGDSVDVFQNISTSFKEVFTLYKTLAGKVHPIAVWVMQNGSNKEIIHDSHTQKVSLKNGNILLQDFQESDEARYVMLYSSKRKEVELCALYPPTLSCKPLITQKGNFRIASLNNPEYCGKPLASVRWMEYPAISYRNKTTIELLPGKEVGKYSACLEGKVLQCVKNLEWANCENFTFGSTSGDYSPTISEIPPLKSTNDVIVWIVSFILSIVVAILIIGIILLWKQFGIRLKSPAGVETEQPMKEQQPLQDVSDDEPRDEEPIVFIEMQRVTNAPDKP